MALDASRVVKDYLGSIGDTGANSKQKEESEKNLQKLVEAIFKEISSNGVVNTAVVTTGGSGTGTGTLT